MSGEFTGERVVPGLVDVNLWNEHISRYAFASRLAAGNRALDMGCGTGYGAALLSREASQVAGIDIASDAIRYARETFSGPRLSWMQASCTALPFRSASFDLVVSFEVIEHLTEWPRMIEEARRLLRDEGRFVVSTPNKSFYLESRAESGPNPFHHHEFEFDEFQSVLREQFAQVDIYLQDHMEGILFRRDEGDLPSIEVQAENERTEPRESNFFVAVCGNATVPSLLPFLYLPQSGNLLRERGLHIQRLANELQTKDSWLKDARQEHQKLVELFRQQTGELEERNRWAANLNVEIAGLHSELSEAQRRHESELKTRTEWAQDLEARLTGDLRACAEALQQADKNFEERTDWALQLQRENEELKAQLASAQASRWVRLGKKLGVGPEIRTS